jgi:hypothetical protein
MKIKCDNGLCDRLRFIFSYFYLAKKNNQKLIVCWNINKKCNGHFLDLFHPIKNLEFTEDDSGVDVSGWRPCIDLKNTAENIYKDLALLPELEQKVKKLVRQMKKYVAVHIRRTDKVANPGPAQKTTKPTTDDEFIKFLKENNSYNIFLATDCHDTQNKFKNTFQDILYWNERIEQPWRFTAEDCNSIIKKNSDAFFRPTSLEATAIDLFTCIQSNKFMGTNLSGMSQFIIYNRLHNKKIKKIL